MVVVVEAVAVVHEVDTVADPEVTQAVQHPPLKTLGSSRLWVVNDSLHFFQLYPFNPLGFYVIPLVSGRLSTGILRTILIIYAFLECKFL